MAGVRKTIFVGEPERKRPLEKPSSRWKYNINTRLKQNETVLRGTVWIRATTNKGFVNK